MFLVLEYNLDVDIFWYLNAHELPQCSFIGSDINQSFMTLIPSGSHVAVPSPLGLFLVGTTSFLVCRGTGPEMLTPVLSAIAFTDRKRHPNVSGLIPDNLLLAFCANLFSSKIKGECPYFCLTLMHMPAAMVIPISRMANLPSCGMDFTGSIHIGFVGLTVTIAASPAFIKVGFSSFTCPTWRSRSSYQYRHKGTCGRVWMWAVEYRCVSNK
jgi:hypothetical protein